MATEAELKRLKVDELKKLLRARRLRVGGRKAELIQRLLDADKEGNPSLAPAKSVARRGKRPVAKKSAKVGARPVAAAQPSAPWGQSFQAGNVSGWGQGSSQGGWGQQGQSPATEPAAAEGPLFSGYWGEQKPHRIPRTGWGPTLPPAAAVVEEGPKYGYLMGKDDSLYVSVAEGSGSCSRVVGFDLDGTLIKTKSGEPFAKDSTDWAWVDPTTPAKLQALRSYSRLVVFSNQLGVSQGKVSLWELEEKMQAIRKAAGAPITFLLSLGHEFRKPKPDMWEYFHTCLNEGRSILAHCAYVGDMAGRPGDLGDSDRKFAKAAGILFLTPEVFFSPCDLFSQSDATIGAGKTVMKKKKNQAAAAIQAAAAPAFQVSSIPSSFGTSADAFAIPSATPAACPNRPALRPLEETLACDDVSKFNAATEAAWGQVDSITGSAPAVLTSGIASIDLNGVTQLRHSTGADGTEVDSCAREAFWANCEQLVKEGKTAELALLMEEAESILQPATVSLQAVNTVCDALRHITDPPRSLLTCLTDFILHEHRQEIRLPALRSLVAMLRPKSGLSRQTFPEAFTRQLINAVQAVGSGGSAILGIRDVDEACCALEVLRLAEVGDVLRAQYVALVTDARLLATPRLAELLLGLGGTLANFCDSTRSNNALLAKFLSLLVHENPDVERQALRFFSNVTAGTDEETQRVLDAGFIREALRCLRTHSCSSLPEAYVVDEVWFCLGNVAAGAPRQAAKLASYARELVPLIVQQLENDRCLPEVQDDICHMLASLFNHRCALQPKAAVGKERAPCKTKVDPHAPQGADVEVVEGWSCMLNQANIAANNNKFFILQLLKSPAGFALFKRWGRVGQPGMNQLLNWGPREAAEQKFKQKFFDKTANLWGADPFVPQPHKYTVIHLSEEEEEETKMRRVEEVASKVAALDGAAEDIHRLFATPALLSAALSLPQERRSFVALIDPTALSEAVRGDRRLEEAYADLLVAAR